MKVDKDGLVFYEKLCVAKIELNHKKTYDIFAVESRWNDLYSIESFKTKKAALEHIDLICKGIFKRILDNE